MIRLEIRPQTVNLRIWKTSVKGKPTGPSPSAPTLGSYCDMTPESRSGPLLDGASLGPDP
jgi:hypothetical protein